MSLRSEIRSVHHHGSVTWELHVFRQARVLVAAGHVYHLWHHLLRPVFIRVERFEQRHRDVRIPYTNRQDIRCARIRAMGRIPVDTYPYTPERP